MDSVVAAAVVVRGIGRATCFVLQSLQELSWGVSPLWTNGLTTLWPRLSPASSMKALTTYFTCVAATGRVAWALLSLMRAGAKGCTPISRPAPRWSDYVFRSRALGINIETIDEPHAGSFAGTHARYVLRDRLEVFGGNLDEYLASSEGQREFGGAMFGRVAA